MAIHIGKKIKEELYRQRISVTGFAKKINRSRNVVYDIFERESVDTDLLNKIGKILNCDFFSIYSAQKEYHQGNVKSFNLREPESVYSQKQNQETQFLHQQMAVLKNEINHLKKIISLLEKEKKSKIPGKKSTRK